MRRYLPPGYRHHPKLSAVQYAGGWLRAGDLGRLADDGRLSLDGRAKDVLFAKDCNAHPSPLAPPDPEIGEPPRAFGAARSGVAGTPEAVS